jgi:hypothetical protein
MTFITGELNHLNAEPVATRTFRCRTHVSLTTAEWRWEGAHEGDVTPFLQNDRYGIGHGPHMRPAGVMCHLF